MKLQNAINLYKSAKEKTERARLDVENRKKRVEERVGDLQSIGLINGVPFEKHIEITCGLHLHEEALRKAETELVKAFQEEAKNNPLSIQKLVDKGLKKDFIYSLFEQRDYEGIRVLITELAILTA